MANATIIDRHGQRIVVGDDKLELTTPLAAVINGKDYSCREIALEHIATKNALAFDVDHWAFEMARLFGIQPAHFLDIDPAERTKLTASVRQYLLKREVPKPQLVKSSGHDRKTYTIDEAAQLLGIGRNHAYEAAKRGEIPSIRIGKRLIVPQAALHRLLEGEPR